MNDISGKDTMIPKTLIFEAAFNTIHELNMSVITNVTDIENDMPVAIVTLQGVNMGIVVKQTLTTANLTRVIYSLNGAILYTVSYPLNENGGTGKGEVQNLLPEDAVTYMGW